MENNIQNPQHKEFKAGWFKAAIVMQFLTAATHSLSFIIKPQPTNDTEKQMIDLMTTYKMDMGAGFTPTFFQLFQSVSAGFALLYVFGGIVNWYLWKRKIDLVTLKGIIVINVIVFGIIFTVNVWLSFISPVATSGLVFFFLIISWITFPKSEVIPAP